MNKNPSPFTMERKRQLLASKKDYHGLKKLYMKGLPEIKDINASKLWNEKLPEAGSFENQDGMTKDRIGTVAKFLPKTVKKVLDIGAGNGYIEEKLNKRHHIKLHGNDISPYAIKNLKKRFKGEYRLESIYEMDYPLHYFDAVLALEVLEHIPPSRIFPLLSKLWKMTKKSAYLIVSVPMNEGLEHMDINPNGHVRTYSEDLIKAELSIAGFKVLKSKKLYAFSKKYRLKKILSHFYARWIPNNIIILAQKI